MNELNNAALMELCDKLREREMTEQVEPILERFADLFIQQPSLKGLLIEAYTHGFHSGVKVGMELMKEIWR